MIGRPRCLVDRVSDDGVIVAVLCSHIARRRLSQPRSLRRSRQRPAFSSSGSTHARPLVPLTRARQPRDPPIGNAPNSIQMMISLVMATAMMGRNVRWVTRYPMQPDRVNVREGVGPGFRWARQWLLGRFEQYFGDCPQSVGVRRVESVSCHARGSAGASASGGVDGFGLVAVLEVAAADAFQQWRHGE
jgi:hypothetical protein